MCFVQTVTAKNFRQLIAVSLQEILSEDVKNAPVAVADLRLTRE